MRAAHLSMLLLIAGCGTASRAAPVAPGVAEWAGCYALEYGSWSAKAPAGATRLPRELRLEAAEHRFWSRASPDDTRWYRASTTAPEPGPWVAWQPRAADSVFVGVPVRTEGFALYLVPDETGLQGEVEAYTDQVTGTSVVEQRAPVWARRIPCTPGLA